MQPDSQQCRVFNKVLFQTVHCSPRILLLPSPPQQRYAPPTPPPEVHQFGDSPTPLFSFRVRFLRCPGRWLLLTRDWRLQLLDPFKFSLLPVVHEAPMPVLKCPPPQLNRPPPTLRTGTVPLDPTHNWHGPQLVLPGPFKVEKRIPKEPGDSINPAVSQAA